MRRNRSEGNVCSQEVGLETCFTVSEISLNHREKKTDTKRALVIGSTIHVKLVIKREFVGSTPSKIQNRKSYRSRKLRSVAVGKRGDDSADFILEKLHHSGASGVTVISSILVLLAVLVPKTHVQFL